jgi:Holliday junction resolvase
METRTTEINKIKQVARDYEKKGYNVKIEPKGNDLPSFIQNYQPDIIASNENETVVIEVKTRADMATIEKLKNVADLINDRKGWRFELVITTSRQETESKRGPLLEGLVITKIDETLNETKELIKLKYYNAAFILTWSYLESLSRQLLLDDKKNLSNRNPLTLVKTLFSFGYISRRELETLEQLFEIRNQVVHGYQASGLDKNSIDKLLDIVEKIAKENR